MINKYSTIRLNNDFSEYVDFNNESIKEINGLSSINVIVGSNNSRKSRFMRKIISIMNLEYKATALQNLDLNTHLVAMELSLRAICIDNNVTDLVITSNITPGVTPQKETFNILDFGMQLKDEFYTLNFIDEIDLRIKKLNVLKNGSRVRTNLNPNQNDIFYEDIKRFINNNLVIFDLLEESKNLEINFKKFYIPILRSLHFFSITQNNKREDIYKNLVEKEYNLSEDKNKVEIFTGLALYDTVRSMLLGDPSERKKISNYEEFLSKLFDGKKVSLIPKEKSHVLNVKIGTNEHPIYDLGDGIQSLIILTFPLFETSQGIFFIEEPEIHLHPALQRKFIEVLKEFPQHQYFITTHSNHFLDLTLDYTDISVYTFNGNEEKTVVQLVSQADENILQLLGAKNSSVFLTNCTIWVEGYTDRLYLRKYLELYQEKYNIKIREDIDYSFVEYGGSNITHWSFLDSNDYPTIDVDRLCGKSFLITDMDGDTKMERKKILTKKLNNRYYMLKCNEIENSLSLKTLQRVIRTYEKDESFIIPEFASAELLEKSKIGEFIENQIFKGKKIKRKGGYKDDSGTIKDKVTFCKKAIDNLTYDELSESALVVTKKVIEFIISQKLN